MTLLNQPTTFLYILYTVQTEQSTPLLNQPTTFMYMLYTVQTEQSTPLLIQPTTNCTINTSIDKNDMIYASQLILRVQGGIQHYQQHKTVPRNGRVGFSQYL